MDPHVLKTMPEYLGRRIPFQQGPCGFWGSSGDWVRTPPIPPLHKRSTRLCLLPGPTVCRRLPAVQTHNITTGPNPTTRHTKGSYSLGRYLGDVI